MNADTPVWVRVLAMLVGLIIFVGGGAGYYYWDVNGVLAFIIALIGLAVVAKSLEEKRNV